MIYAISKPGLDLIRRSEGCRLTAYRCPAGVWTVGYGHTGPDVTEGMTITQERAEELLAADVAEFEKRVQQLVTAPMTQGQFDAMVSFAYNVGLNAFAASTLLRKFNAEDYDGAAAEFARWNRGGGKVLPGLVARRNEERAMFEESPLSA